MSQARKNIFLGQKKIFIFLPFYSKLGLVTKEWVPFIKRKEQLYQDHGKQQVVFAQDTDQVQQLYHQVIVKSHQPWLMRLDSKIIQLLQISI